LIHRYLLLERSYQPTKKSDREAAKSAKENAKKKMGGLKKVAWASRPCIYSAKKHGRDAHATRYSISPNPFLPQRA